MEYRGFFSYSRSDERVANWLWRQLDGYTVPKDLVGSRGRFGDLPAKLHPFFRDRSDLGSGGALSEELEQALERSECLVVLCSPSAANSRWVDKEVETFFRLGRADRVFPVIVDGEPECVDPSRECFPPSLRGKGILAADIRDIRRPSGERIGDGRYVGRLKLIAGILGVELDAILRRERRRQGAVLALMSAAAIVFALVAALAGVGFVKADANARTARQNERAALASIARVLVERGWQAKAQGAYQLAAKYALAAPALISGQNEEARLLLASLVRDKAERRPLLAPRGGNWGELLWVSDDGETGLIESTEYEEDSYICRVSFRLRSVEKCTAGWRPLDVAASGREFLLPAEPLIGQIDFNAPEIDPPPEFDTINSPQFQLEAVLNPTPALFAPPAPATVDNDTDQGRDDFGGGRDDEVDAVYSTSERHILTSRRGRDVFHLRLWSRDGGRLVASADLRVKSIGLLAYDDAREEIIVVGKDINENSIVATQDIRARIWRASLLHARANMSVGEGRYISGQDHFLGLLGGHLILASRSGVYAIDLSTIGDGQALKSTLLRNVTGPRPLYAADNTLGIAAVVYADGSALVLALAKGRVESRAFYKTGISSPVAAFVLASEKLVLQTSDGRIERRDLMPAMPVAEFDASSVHYYEDELSWIGATPDGKGIIADGVYYGSAKPQPHVAAKAACERAKGTLLFAPGERHVLCSVEGARPTMRVFDQGNGELVWSGAGECVAAWSPGRGAVALQSGRTRLEVTSFADATKNWAIRDIGRPTDCARPIPVALSDDGVRLFAIDGKGVLTAYEQSLPAPRWRLVSGAGEYAALSAGRRGDVLVATDAAGVDIIDSKRGVVTERIESPNAIASLAEISPDGRLIAFVEGETTVRIWDVRTRRVVRTLSDFYREVRQLRFSMDGQALAVAETYGRLTLWPISEFARSYEDLKTAVCSGANGRRALAFTEPEKAADELLRSPWARGIAAQDLCSNREPNGR